jgi:transmembrane 9 superfamily protein 2/4
MGVATLTFALLGLLSPANRGSLITAFILLFVFMGSFAGYFSSSIYKMFRGILWKQNTLMTAFFFPGVVFSVIFALNVILWAEGSSGAIPFGSLFTLLFLWFCVSVPLVFLGSFFGYKRCVVRASASPQLCTLYASLHTQISGMFPLLPPPQHRREIATFPVRTNQIPRAIPQQQWYLHPVISCMLGGILPFGAVSVELYFIMSALWLHQIYYIFGFLFLVMIVLVVTCAEVSILLCYFQVPTDNAYSISALYR